VTAEKSKKHWWSSANTANRLNNYSRVASTVHNNFKNYFCSPEGSVEWKMERVQRV